MSLKRSTKRVLSDSAFRRKLTPRSDKTSRKLLAGNLKQIRRGRAAMGHKKKTVFLGKGNLDRTTIFGRS
jgi:hypothetical protein